MNIKQRERIGIRPSIVSKVIYIGKYKADGYQNKLNVFCKVEYQDQKLSISGVIGPLKNGNCQGSSGQMYDSIIENLKTFDFADGWSKTIAFEFVELWKEWHLNDMQAGTPKQEAFIKEWIKENKYDYTEVCEALKKARLYTDKGYKYGSAWLSKEIPDKVLEFFNKLPEASKTPMWI